NATITYVENLYALNAGLDVVKVLNRGGYYVPPTASNVSGAPLPGGDDDGDPRGYPPARYSQQVAATTTGFLFTLNKGFTLSTFARYGLCEGRQSAPVLGYAPLPVNLVQAGLDQLRQVPGADLASLTLSGCGNPTFDSGGNDLLAATAPFPPPCDQQGPVQCGASPPPGPGSETLTTTLPAGSLVISVDGAPVLLPEPQLDPTDTLLTTAGNLNPVTVVDTRAGNLGWTVSGQVTDFTRTEGPGAINGYALGWNPEVTTQAPAQTVIAGAPVLPAAGIAPGATPPDPNQGLKTARTLATAPPAAGIGTAVVTAVLHLAAPTSTPAGHYTATLTLTLI